MRKFCAIAGFLSLATLVAAAFDPAAFNAAVKLYDQHLLLEAQQAFEPLAAANPTNANIQFYLGRLALQRDDHEKAVLYLGKAVELAPNDSRFHQRLGDAYGLTAQKAGFFSQLGWAKKCQAEYEKAVELDPKSIDARWSLMEYCRQAPGIIGGGNDKALVQAQEIKKLDDTRGRVAVALVLASDKKYDLAFAEFEEVLKMKPADYSALFQTGRLAAISGLRLDRGLTVLQQCLTMTPPENQPGHAAAHWRIGNILEKQGDKPGARAAYEASLKADPKFSQAIEALKKLN
jgi:tetratricopeptide (TPR) repeat protein